jgi:hypothetical protein
MIKGLWIELNNHIRKNHLNGSLFEAINNKEFAHPHICTSAHFPLIFASSIIKFEVFS